MSITEDTRNYEILVRFNDDGSVGAHLQQITEIKKDGSVISATVLDPIQVSIDEVRAIIDSGSESA